MHQTEMHDVAKAGFGAREGKRTRRGVTGKRQGIEETQRRESKEMNLIEKEMSQEQERRKALIHGQLQNSIQTAATIA